MSIKAILASDKRTPGIGDYAGIVADGSAEFRRHIGRAQRGAGK